MGIADIFKNPFASAANNGSQNQNQNQPTPPTPGNIPPNSANNTQSVQNSSTAPNGAIPATGSNSNPANNPSESPADKYKDLWEPVKIDPANPNNGNKPYFNLDKSKMQEAAKSFNFSSSVTAEQLQAIAAGGEGAVKAFQESMNNVAQNVFAESANVSATLIEKALAEAKGNFQKDIPGMIKSYQVGSNLTTENPALNNPAVRPLIDAVRTQMQIKNPLASDVELTAKTREYLSDVLGKLTPQKVDPVQAAKDQGTDWEEWLG